MMIDNSRDADNWIKLAERVDKKSALQFWEDRADKLYLLNGKQMVVIEVDPRHYQCWSKAIADKFGKDWVYETKGGNDVVASVVDPRD